MVILCLVIALVLLPRLWLWINRPITLVEVHAPFVYMQKNDVEALLTDQLKRNFFQLDLKSIRKLLVDQQGIKEVYLRKQWPNKIIVSLEEKEPIARWYNNQLLSADGDIFTPMTMSRFEELPVLKGPDRQAYEVMQQYLAISQLLRPLGLVVRELQLGQTGAWSFRLGSVQVNLGKRQRIERIQRFIRLYHAKLESSWQWIKRIDLRYSNGASIAWSDE